MAWDKETFVYLFRHYVYDKYGYELVDYAYSVLFLNYTFLFKKENTVKFVDISTRDLTNMTPETFYDFIKKNFEMKEGLEKEIEDLYTMGYRDSE